MKLSISALFLLMAHQGARTAMAANSSSSSSNLRGGLQHEGAAANKLGPIQATAEEIKQRSLCGSYPCGGFPLHFGSDGLTPNKSNFASNEPVSLLIALVNPGNPWVGVWPVGSVTDPTAIHDGGALIAHAYTCSNSHDPSCPTPLSNVGTVTFSNLPCGVPLEAYMIESQGSSPWSSIAQTSTSFTVACPVPTPAPTTASPTTLPPTTTAPTAATHPPTAETTYWDGDEDVIPQGPPN